MNIITYSDQLHAQLKQYDQEVSNTSDVIKMAQAVKNTRAIIHELQKFISHYHFTDEAEEIKFFKEIKPVFVSQYLYYKMLFAINVFNSFRDSKSILENYNRILRKMQRYVSRNESLFEYVMGNNTYNDQKYFLRNANRGSIHQDTNFTTGYDTKLAKMITHELMRSYLSRAILLLQSSAAQTEYKLKWTGAKTDLVELIYALHASKTINDANVDVKLLATGFETMFNVDLGSYYRTFQEIRIRKGSQTKFLDLLKDKLLNKLDESAS